MLRKFSAAKLSICAHMQTGWALVSSLSFVWQFHQIWIYSGMIGQLFFFSGSQNLIWFWHDWPFEFIRQVRQILFLFRQDSPHVLFGWRHIFYSASLLTLSYSGANLFFEIRKESLKSNFWTYCWASLPIESAVGLGMIVSGHLAFKLASFATLYLFQIYCVFLNFICESYRQGSQFCSVWRQVCP